MIQEATHTHTKRAMFPVMFPGVLFNKNRFLCPFYDGVREIRDLHTHTHTVPGIRNKDSLLEKNPC